jgi:hypothetical protein
MELKEIVKIAIDYIAEIFSDEKPSNIGLEEITYNEQDDVWSVTVGFSRPWDFHSTILSETLQQKQAARVYKIVKISNKNGKVNAITIRD